jgi:hypothetical protein
MKTSVGGVNVYFHIILQCEDYCHIFSCKVKNCVGLDLAKNEVAIPRLLFCHHKHSVGNA